ncbi:MAG: hypothetical protein QM755_02975 [Luteolibacter sp.]
MCLKIRVHDPSQRNFHSHPEWKYRNGRDDEIERVPGDESGHTHRDGGGPMRLCHVLFISLAENGGGQMRQGRIHLGWTGENQGNRDPGSR